MSALKRSAPDAPPDWLAAEMPPGYQNRLAEIRRLTDELEAMDRFGRLLWQTGEPLAGALHDTFKAIGLDTEPLAGTPASGVQVKLDGRRRLFLQAASTPTPLQKSDTELAQLFRLVQEVAEESDRVVLVTNGDPLTAPADRTDPVGPEALTLLRRLGVNVAQGSAIFGLWTLWQQDKERARAGLDRLHAQDGGPFTLPTAPKA